MSISREQALDCFASDDLIGIGMEADAVRRALHPEGVVSYAIHGHVDLTGVQNDPALQVAEALDLGATGIVLRGAAGRDLAWCEETLAKLRRLYPDVGFEGFSADEITDLASLSRLAVAEVLIRLKAAGLSSLTGDRGTLSDQQYLGIHRSAHQAGIPSTAEMVYGGEGSMEDNVAFLEALRTLQSETHGLLAFTLSCAPSTTGRELDEATAVEYLKTLAICRMVLDNILHLQTNLAQQGLKVVQMGLRFGGNDLGSVFAAPSASEEELRRIVRDAGFKPAQRDTLYRAMFLN